MADSPTPTNDHASVTVGDPVHREFATVSRQVSPTLPDAYHDFAQLVAYHETKYGRGWSAQRSARAPGSFNMGAITGVGPTGDFFEHQDSKRNDKTGEIEVYTTKFRRYPTYAAGVADLHKVLFKPNVRRALDAKSIRAAVTAMYANKYYLTTQPKGPKAPASYLQALTKWAPTVSTALGRKLALTDIGIPATEADLLNELRLLQWWGETPREHALAKVSAFTGAGTVQPAPSSSPQPGPMPPPKTEGARPTPPQPQPSTTIDPLGMYAIMTADVQLLADKPITEQEAKELFKALAARFPNLRVAKAVNGKWEKWGDKV